MTSLDAIAPAFVDMAHRIVWCTVATLDGTGRPRTRVLHPLWEWDGERLTGWVATGPTPVKSAGIAETPHVSLTYWDATQDTCTAECEATWITDDDGRTALWRRFVDGAGARRLRPVDDPGLGQTRPHLHSPDGASTPTDSGSSPGTLMLEGHGELLTWRA